MFAPDHLGRSETLQATLPAITHVQLHLSALSNICKLLQHITICHNASTAVVQDHFCGNNSGRSELIGTKFCRCHSHLQTFGASAKRVQNGGDKTALCKLFVAKTMHHSTLFLEANFSKILTQNTNQCGQKFFEQNWEMFPIRDHLPPNTSL